MKRHDSTHIMSVCFLFTPDIEEVLMIHKLRGPYPETWNGVGGKFNMELDNISNDPRINMKACAKREIFEETSLDIDTSLLCWIVTETFPPGEQPPWGTKGKPLELWVYCAVVDKDTIKQVENETLKWFDIDELLNDKVYDETLAGSGNIPYFINLSKIYLTNLMKDVDACEN